MNFHFTLLLQLILIHIIKISIIIDLKMPSNATSEHQILFFKIFLGGIPPDSPMHSISILCIGEYTMLIVLHTITHNNAYTMKYAPVK